MTEEELDRRIDILAAKQIMAQADDESYDYEREKYRIIKQNGYKPDGFIDELTKPKRDKDGQLIKDEKSHIVYDDRLDRKSLLDSTLSVRENTHNIKNVWRNEAYRALVHCD